MTHALLFPGQGSQYTGMGKPLIENFVAAREVFQEADDALSEKLSALVFDGSEAELRLTENAQPALLTLSIAVLRVLEREFSVDWTKISPLLAGHSLGEYSALCAAGVLPFSECVRLLRLRGQAMQRAVAAGDGAMAALLGLSLEDAREIVDKASRETRLCCVIANDNAVGQVVVSGAKSAVDRAVAFAKERGKRSIFLDVSAPFHSPLMKPAEDVMAKALGEVAFQDARFDVIANVTAEPERNRETLRDLLVQQVCSSVRWRESLLRLESMGARKFWELGAGKALCGMVKRTLQHGLCQSLLTPQQIEQAAKTLV